ncbi:OmpH family outer membrane protein [Planctomicrobium sp. SH664]|uniref:OmpH family outer membrane protein n=1 Tax=Planctomicrobium sp. SH664 TaxID=3448125 RepID=UPI003F5B339B
MVRHGVSAAIAIVASLAVCVCWSSFSGSQKHTGVAVVDLDEVARRLGRAEEMTQTFQGSASKLQQQLNQIQIQATEKLKEARSKIGEHPTQEETAQFNRLTQQVNLEFNQLKKQAETQLGKHRQQLENRFRDEARPVASKLAHDKGFGTVVTKNDALIFAFDETVDLTEDVIKLMSATAPAKAEAPAAPAAAPATQNPIQQTSNEVPATK